MWRRICSGRCPPTFRTARAWRSTKLRSTPFTRIFSEIMAVLTPSYDVFAEAYAAGKNQVVYARLAADLDTPVSLMLKLTGAAKDAFMLESVTGGEVRGRYSIIGMKPDVVWKCHGTTARLNRQARFDTESFEDEREAPLE